MVGSPSRHLTLHFIRSFQGHKWCTIADISTFGSHYKNKSSYSDSDIKRIYDREREREIDQIQFILVKNVHRFASINDTKAAAMVIHNAVENVAHTAKFIGTEIEEDRLTDNLADMISGFILGNRENIA